MPNSINKSTFLSARLGDVMAEATHDLKSAGFDDPSLDVQWLIGDVLALDRTQLFFQKDRLLSDVEKEHIANNIAQRIAHTPVARILGEREFWGLPFGLNEATLEPRPDSETLIETTLKHIARNEAPLRIADLGTGTGCLLLSLLHALPKASGLGIDLSPRAVEQAQKNARRLNLETRATFITQNWLEGLGETFDIILSNPPYIATDILPTLMPEVRDHDPSLALDGGHDGLTPYRYLIPQLPRVLKPKGLAIFEVGHDQAAFVAHLMSQNGLQDIEIHKDLGGIERCVIGIKA